MVKLWSSNIFVTETIHHLKLKNELRGTPPFLGFILFKGSLLWFEE